MKNFIFILAILVSGIFIACTKTTATTTKKMNTNATNESTISTDKIEKEIAARYQEMDKAVKNQNAKTIIEMENVSFWVLIKNGKFKSKADADDELTRFLESFDEFSEAKTTIQKFEAVKEMKISPDKTAPVTGVYAATVKHAFKGKTSGSTGKQSDIEVETKVTDYWAKNAKGLWEMILTVEVGMKIMSDGDTLIEGGND